MITITRYVDDLTFSLATSSSGCNVKAYSTSRTWYIKNLLQKDKNMSDMPFPGMPCWIWGPTTATCGTL